MTKNLRAIVIPSAGSVKEDLSRAKTAINYSKENNTSAPYIISGLGPDTNEALDSYDQNLDFHKDLYEHLRDNTEERIGVDTKSLNSIENILNTFPKGIEGNYAIVSSPKHVRRFKKIIKDARKVRKLSDNLNIEFVKTEEDSKGSLKELVYEILANVKYELIGKKKYFSE